jgi:hypothetical protein
VGASGIAPSAPKEEGIMSILVRKSRTAHRLLRSAALALVLAAVAGGVAMRPARADEGWYRGYERPQWQEHQWREHQWREHAWREHEWREREWRIHHGYAYGPPAYVYAPAPAYVPAPAYAYAPPPVIYAPPAGSLSFVFPLGHR